MNKAVRIIAILGLIVILGIAGLVGYLVFLNKQGSSDVNSKAKEQIPIAYQTISLPASYTLLHKEFTSGSCMDNCPLYTYSYKTSDDRQAAYEKLITAIKTANCSYNDYFTSSGSIVVPNCRNLRITYTLSPIPSRSYEAVGVIKSIKAEIMLVN